MARSAESYRLVIAAVARELQGAREKQRLSMSRVAEDAGLSQQMVSYVERGMRTPTLETLLRICAALNVDLSDVVRAASRPATKPRKG